MRELFGVVAISKVNPAGIPVYVEPSTFSTQNLKRD